MEWKDLANTIGKVAPLLGTLIGGPACTAIGGLISSVIGSQNTPEAINQALIADPNLAVKLLQIESGQRIQLQELLVDQAKAELASATQNISDVNQTMQVEERDAQHWMSYTWRPFIGFITGIMVIGIYFLLPLLKIPVPVVPETLWVLLASILGVASFFHGKALADPANTAVTRG